MIGNYQVDEHGRTYGFSAESDAGCYGDNLEAGQLVSLDDGGSGVVAKVYGRIHAGCAGCSNYVCVDIYPSD